MFKYWNGGKPSRIEAMPSEYPSFTVPDAPTARRLIRRSITVSVWSLLPVVLFVGTVAAQANATGGTGSAFCTTSMAETIENVFRLIQFGGPLIGGALALGATVIHPLTRQSNVKKELKDIRNQGLLWGVLVAPLGTEIVGFLLNHVVAGGSSCAF